MRYSAYWPIAWKGIVAKAKKAFVCNECGGEHSKWQGQCSDCGEWNTLSEIILQPAAAKSANTPRFSGYAGEQSNQVQTLAEIDLQELPRISTGVGELDRVLSYLLPPLLTFILGVVGASLASSMVTPP